MQLESCLQEIRIWMARNSLKLNESKTDFIIFGTKQMLANLSTSHVTIGDSCVPSSEKVKNIGATLDQYLKMDSQVNASSKSAWYNLYQISKIKRFFSEDQLKSVIQAFVISKIDMNNCLLAGSSACLTRKLQSVQNAAAKLIHGIGRWERIEPPLKDLHWLPVSYRIKFKVLLLVYKSLNDKGPLYLKELLVPYNPSRNLRSASALKLSVPKSRLKTCGDKAFCVIGPKLWNSLPCSIKSSPSVASFKKSLKTHFFKQAFC